MQDASVSYRAQMERMRALPKGNNEPAIAKVPYSYTTKLGAFKASDESISSKSSRKNIDVKRLHL
jgi:hypothetical protein